MEEIPLATAPGFYFGRKRDCMEEFYQVIKGLSANQNYRTAVGIDGALTGQKAVLSEDTVLYQTEGFPKEALKRLRALDLEAQKAAESPRTDGRFQRDGRGLLETQWGRVFVEVLGSRKKMVLCGGGHVSLATLAIASMTEFHITVVEDRPEFAQAAGKAGADEVICDNFVHGMKELETDLDTYVVVMTRGHRHDLECLRQLLTKEYAYLGMMGSRSRVHKIKEQLKAEGFSEERIEALHAPIGLPISAVTPAEIGVSVLAEVIKEKNQKKRQVAYEKEVADWLFAEGETKRSPAVLATIIARKGSAPRQAGTKMMIFPDGSSLGTIGGGCMEAEVKSQARHMLAGSNRHTTCFVDMTGPEAEEEGMVCGGTMEIFLEVL